MSRRPTYYTSRSRPVNEQERRDFLEICDDRYNRAGANLRLTVIDTGGGIPAEDLPRISIHFIKGRIILGWFRARVSACPTSRNLSTCTRVRSASIRHWSMEQRSSSSCLPCPEFKSLMR